MCDEFQSSAMMLEVRTVSCVDEMRKGLHISLQPVTIVVVYVSSAGARGPVLFVVCRYQQQAFRASILRSMLSGPRIQSAQLCCVVVYFELAGTCA